ncbi:MAG TPA: hypothetical protein VND64_25565 [Pirellulales bacterium]|nr:hypothetical protein [Pirellulales bacterium]
MFQGKEIGRTSVIWPPLTLASSMLVVVIAESVAHGHQPDTAQLPFIRDSQSDTWVAIDPLGRRLPTYEQVGPPREDRKVGIFYFLWHGAHVNDDWHGPYDITKILARDPDAMRTKTNPLWGPIGAPHHWGESLFGYYLTDDAYVLRKHAQMLADAGVDTLIFDVSNEFTCRRYYMELLRIFSDVRKKGGKTPQVAFLTPFSEPSKVIRELYHDLYEPGHYSDLWFQWEGKPLILTDPAKIAPGPMFAEQNDPALLERGHSLGQSFTMDAPFDAAGGRFPTWSTRGSQMTLTLHRDGPNGEPIAKRRLVNVQDNAWLWVEVPDPLPPGTYYLEISEPDGMIGWWSHTGDVIPQGGAFADGESVKGDRTLRIGVVTEERSRIRSFFTFRKPQADYFNGQTEPDMWSWLEVYPQHVFRNSRGEKEQMSVGVAQNAVGDRVGAMSEPEARGRSFHNDTFPKERDAVLHGYNATEQWERALKEDPKFVFVTGWNEWFAGRMETFPGTHAPVIFVDAFDQEHSRDIEPMVGGHGDLYYYQMVGYIRNFKGVHKPPVASPPRTIDLDDFPAWADVRPEFLDDIGDPAQRDHPGYDKSTRYVNTSGRNDFTAAKVTWDREFVYFYIRTQDAITPFRDPNWMLLFIDTGVHRQTAWEGYNFVVNRTLRDSTTTLLEESKGGWAWRRKGEVRYRVAGNELALRIRRADLGLADRNLPVQFDFKWADNVQEPGKINEFTLNGDCAPNGRFNFRYRGIR